ncbi:hypothetical protein [Rheinheimera hassiensis]|uniref:hypothetical protein n=1 Tax=Rheinheimera hassiensis TaxID=1193627 RepID=UPI001F058F24|nr:hypothetical protein [Rheinheimera hassiensis]
MLKSLTPALLCAVLLACSPNPEQPASIEGVKQMIIKRWLQSPKHCQGLLDDQISDFTFLEEGIKSGGAIVKGSYSFYDNEDAHKHFYEFLKANSNCDRNFPKTDTPFLMIKFSTFEQTFILAVFEGQEFMLRLVGNEVFPVIPFPDDSDYLRTLNYED